MLVILVASASAVFCIAGWLPGHIAKTRGHPQAQAVTVAGWVTLICGFALWPIALIWAYVDVPASARQERRHDGRADDGLSGAAVPAGAFRIVRFNLFWKVSPFIVLLLLNFGLLIPMGWGAPQGRRWSCATPVSIVPNVAGEVTDVPVAPTRR